MAGVAVYLRTSTEEQATAGTIENQRAFALGYVELHKLGEPVEFADDGYSGAIPLEQRPAGQRLLQAVGAGLISTVYVYKLDRLGRSARVILNAKEELDARGARLVSMTEPFDTRDASGQFLLTVLSGVAALERDNIAERTQAGIRRAVREGKWVAGPAPYGYRLERREQGNYLAVNEDPLPGCPLSSAGVIRLLYERIGSHGWTTTQACEELLRLQVPPVTPPGSRLNRFRNPVISGWHGNGIAPFLRNSIYKGMVVFGKRSKRGPVVGACPALVSEALWDATAQRLAQGYARAGFDGPAGYLLSGVLICSACGWTMTGVSHRQPTGTYRYYRCSPHRGSPPCRAGVLPMEEVNQRVWRGVERFLADPERALDAIELELAARTPAPTQAAALELALGEKERERERVLVLARRGLTTVEETERDLAAIEGEKLSLTLQLQAAQPLTDHAWRQDAATLHHAAHRVLAQAHSPTTQREAIRLLVRRVVAPRGEDEEWRIEWAFAPQFFHQP